MEEYEDLIIDELRKRGKYYDSILVKLDKLILKIKNELYKSIKKDLYDMSEKGELKPSIDILRYSLSVGNKIENIVANSKLFSEISGVNDNLDIIDDWTISIQKKLNDEDIDIEDYLVLRNWIPGRLERIKSESLGKYLSNPIQDIIRSIYGSIRNTSLYTTLKELERVLFGPEGKSGLFRNFIINEINDTLQTYEASLNGRIRTNLGLDAYLYVPIISKFKNKTKSRPQCIKWTAQTVLRVNNLESEIEWAQRYGLGLKPGTDVENFEINRGGYNCRHQAIPFRLR